jgi:hypothetical protein
VPANGLIENGVSNGGTRGFGSKTHSKGTQQERQQSTTSAASTNEIKSLRQIEAGVGGRDHDGDDWLALSLSWGLIALESEQKQELKLKSASRRP